MRRFSVKQLLKGIFYLAVILTALAAVNRMVRPFDVAAFTPADWAKADSTGRARMSGDLIRDHLPRGLSRSQVQALLGTPDDTVAPNGYGARDADTHKYYIGC